jgi:hypothetical protein
MNKEIKEKVEARRQELKAESERVRKDAKEKHMCANCGNLLLPGRRTYCSNACSVEFFSKFDYSADSEILREYARKLKDEYDAAHPREERQPWSQPAARRGYKCYFCETEIRKGEKYEKYVRLPEYDEWFDDAPYETLRYHITCQEFINLLSNAGLLSDEGFDEDEVSALLAVIALEMHKDYEILINEIVSGVFPSRDELERIANDYEFFEPECHWESDHSGYRYVYSVRYESFNRPLVRVHSFLSELKDPESFFYYYYREINGPEFNRILSVKGIKIPLPKVEVMK